LHFGDSIALRIDDGSGVQRGWPRVARSGLYGLADERDDETVD
jgi:hypothetical protein